MEDILKELREPLPIVEGYNGEYVDADAVLGIFKDAADEIERLREAIRQADCVFELLAPANHGQTTDAEMYSLLSSVGEKLSDMIAEWENATLGEKES